MFRWVDDLHGQLGAVRKAVVHGVETLSREEVGGGVRMMVVVVMVMVIGFPDSVTGGNGDGMMVIVLVLFAAFRDGDRV